MMALIAWIAVVLMRPAATPDAPTHRLVIITGPSEPMTDISSDVLRRIYLGRITRSRGRRIVPVILPSADSAERYFLTTVLGVDEIDFTYLWIGAVFRGEVSAPPHLARSPRAAMAFVTSHQGAIAYIDASDLAGGVKPLTVDGRRFDETDYPLQWHPR